MPCEKRRREAGKRESKSTYAGARGWEEAGLGGAAWSYLGRKTSKKSRPTSTRRRMGTYVL